MSSSRTVAKKPKRRCDWFIVLTLGIVGYFSYMFISQQIYLNSVSSDCESAKVRLQAARDTNEQLQQEKSQLEDSAFIEKIAREELGMTRQGEMPYICSQKAK